MKPHMCLILQLLIAHVSIGNAVIQRFEIYKIVGSSVIFPAVNITERTWFDLRFHGHIIVTHDGGITVRYPYTQRAQFSRTGEFVLSNLTESDSGTYQQEVNLKIVAYIDLYVAPMREPTLWKVNETIHGGQCLAILECRVQSQVPLNTTFQKDGKEILRNITRMDNSSYLFLDIWDPGSSGAYTCTAQSRLGAKTSSEIRLLAEDNDCKDTTSDPGNWRIILIILISIIGVIIMIIVYFVHKKYKKKPVPESGDVESGYTTKDTSMVGDNQSEDGRKGSYHEVPDTDPDKPGDNDTPDSGLELPTVEDTPKMLDPGHLGQEDVLKRQKLASDHGQVANG